MNVRPHVAQNLTRCRGRSAVDSRTTRHPGYAASQRVRKRIEEGFGWMKAVAGLDRPKLRGVGRVGWLILRVRRLQPRPPAETVCDTGMSEITDAPPQRSSSKAHDAPCRGRRR